MIQISEETRKFGSVISEFGYKVFSQLGEAAEKNTFISPYSISLALSMAVFGAKGETKDSIVNTLGFGDFQIGQLHSDILEKFPEDGIKIANSFWGHKDIVFEPEFVSFLAEDFSAKIESLDFSLPSSVEKVNKWVSQNTNNKIKKIVDSFTPDQVAILLQAIWFKMDWQNKFEKENTEKDTFYLAHGEKKKHPFMRRNGDFSYSKTDEFQAVRLPYVGGTISMYVFLPSKKTGLQNLLSKLNQDWWNSNFFRSNPGELIFPKFKMEYETKLKDILSNLGMGLAFSDSADFSSMSKSPMAIDEVIHKTFVQVNEEGTEAAAVTGMVFRTLSAKVPKEPFKMNVNRPFFFMIRDDISNVPLFMGTVVDPED